MAARTNEALQKLCKAKFGNLVRAWNKVFDTSGDGKLSFGEMVDACRNMGFGGNIKALWAEMDQDESGFISLWEFDPDASSGLSEFYESGFISLWEFDPD